MNCIFKIVILSLTLALGSCTGTLPPIEDTRPDIKPGAKFIPSDFTCGKKPGAPDPDKFDPAKDPAAAAKAGSADARYQVRLNRHDDCQAEKLAAAEAKARAAGQVVHPQK